MKIVILGASGFIGRNLCAGLHDHHEVLTPTSRELDLTDYVAVERYIQEQSIEIVIHSAVGSALASERDEGFLSDLKMLTSITRNLDQLKKVILFGSGAEFAKTRDMEKVSEDQLGEYIPHDPYGLSKYLTQEIIKREPKMINLRLFGVYGQYEDYQRKFISNAIVKNLLGLPISIKQDVLFDYLYIDDLIPVVEYFLTHKSKYRDYNVTPTQSITLRQIATIINEVSSQKSPIEIVNPGMNFAYTGDNARLAKELPFITYTSYKNGIMQLMSYYREMLPTMNLVAIKNDKFLDEAKKRV